MPDSVKLNEARDRTKACHQELVELEIRAGIAEAAEKLRTEPPHYHLVYDAAEPYSDAQREQSKRRRHFISSAPLAVFATCISQSRMPSSAKS